MAALNNEVKAFIVQALACFESPSQVAEAVRAPYGLKLLEQAAKECGEMYVGRRAASEGASQVLAARVAVEFVRSSDYALG